MTDPFDALTSFQQALLDGEISLQTGELDPDLYISINPLAGWLTGAGREVAKLYYQGQMPDGSAPTAPDHRTRLRLKPFSSHGRKPSGTE